MAVDLGAARERLLDGKFRELFVDVLGWYPPDGGGTAVRTPAVSFECLAEYAGFQVLFARPGRKLHVPASIQSRLVRDTARTLDCDCLVVWASRDFGESLWQGCIRDNPDLPAYRLSHRELSGHMRNILDALCFWGCNPLHFSSSAVSSLLEQALASKPSGGDRDAVRRFPRRRRLFEDGHFASDEELAMVARVTGEGPPRALLRPAPLDTGYAPVNRSQRAFSGGYLHADLLASPDAEKNEEGLHAHLTRAMEGALSPRERNLLTLRFGLDGGGSRTLEQLGKELSVSRERVRQIEAKALRRLRHPKWSRSLADFLSDTRPLPSPWPQFWQMARGRRFGTFKSRAELRLAEFEARRAPAGGWTDDEVIARAERIAEMTEEVKRVRDEEMAEGQLGDVLLRGAAGTVRLTEVRLRAVSDFRRELIAHRPKRELPRAQFEWRAERHIEWWAIQEVRRWIDSGSRPSPQGFSQRRALTQEVTLQAALTVVQLCGFKVDDRRLDDRALWIHDPGMRLHLDALTELGLRFRPSSYRYEGAWVRAWWFK